jgi:hypothetical protein
MEQKDTKKTIFIIMKIINNGSLEQFKTLDANLKDIGDNITNYKYRNNNWLFWAILAERYDILQYLNQQNYYSTYPERCDRYGDPLMRIMAFNNSPIYLIKEESQKLNKLITKEAFFDELIALHKLYYAA